MGEEVLEGAAPETASGARRRKAVLGEQRARPTGLRTYASALVNNDRKLFTSKDVIKTQVLTILATTIFGFLNGPQPGSKTQVTLSLDGFHQTVFRCPEHNFLYEESALRLADGRSHPVTKPVAELN